MRLPNEESIAVNGRILHYFEWHQQEPPSVLLLHGLRSNAHYWDFLAQSLGEEFHVLSLDQRGHGDSDWADSYGPRDYISDLESFVNELGLVDLVLIGHSLGGINSILYASIHPDLIRKLVIVDIGPEIAPEGARRMRLEMKNEPEHFSSTGELYHYLRKMNDLCDDEFLIYQIHHTVRQNKDGQYTFKFDPILRKTSINSPQWVWDYLKGILCPVLLLHGEKSDILSVDTARKMKEILPCCSLKEIPGAGHGIPSDTPELFHREVSEFLRT